MALSADDNRELGLVCLTLLCVKLLERTKNLGKLFLQDRVELSLIFMLIFDNEDSLH